MTTLPSWAEDVVRRWGPHPAFGRDEVDAEAKANYAAIIDRFRRRWRDELQADVWDLFGEAHHVQAQHLLGVMIDLARYGSRAEMAAKRQALADLGQVEDDVRSLAEELRHKLRLRAEVMHTHLLYGGLEDDLADALARAADAVVIQSWAEPRLHNTDFECAINSRKTARDAINAMLYALDGIEALLAPVRLTDRARAAIFNVAHDTDGAEHYAAEVIKKARADLRRRR